MKIITITREYGAGGGEVARKLAEALGWELLDRELLIRLRRSNMCRMPSLSGSTKRPSRWPTASACTRHIKNTCMV